MNPFIVFSEALRKLLRRKEAEDQFSELQHVLFGSEEVLQFYNAKSEGYVDIRTIFQTTKEQDKELIDHFGLFKDENLDKTAFDVAKHVNNIMTYTADNVKYGKPEYWDDPYNVFKGRRDDCLLEDTPLIVNYGGSSDIIQVADLVPEGFPENVKFFLPKPIWILCGRKFKKINWVVKKRTDKEIYRIRTEKSIIDVTEDHKVLCKQGLKNVWVEAKNIKRMRLQLGNRRKASELFGNGLVSYEIGWLYGFFVAEGYSGSNIWRLYNTDITLLEKAKNILEGKRWYKIRSLKFTIKEYPCFAKGQKTSRGQRTKTLYVLQASTSQRGSLNLFVKRFRKDCYTSLGDKRIPMAVLRGSLNAKQGFIDGHFAGDAGYTSSKTLAFGLCLLYESLGKDAKIHDIINRNFHIEQGRRSKKVNSSLKLGKTDKFVYDLNVDEPHYFNAGEVTVHNCDGYAALIVKVWGLLGIPASRRLVWCGDVFDANLNYAGGHAVPIYLSYATNEWYPVEGSYFAEITNLKFNVVPFWQNRTYGKSWFCTNEEKSYRGNRFAGGSISQ